MRRLVLAEHLEAPGGSALASGVEGVLGVGGEARPAPCRPLVVAGG